jgi:hypothetical protein
MSAVQCQHEVERLHLFFQDWFTGRLEKSPEVLEDQCTAHFADDFSRITPLGTLVSKAQLVMGLMHAHSSHSRAFELHIHNVQILLNLTPTLKLVTYEEWQRAEGEVTTARRATALLSLQENGIIQWKFVQETWMDGKGPQQQQPSQQPQQPQQQLLKVPSMSLISPRRHMSEQLTSQGATLIFDGTDTVVGINFRGITIETLQGPMANEAWLNHTTEQLLELCQYSPQQRRRINLPEVCFSHATVKVTLGSLSLTWNCYEALHAWSRAHAAIQLGSSMEFQGVSVLKTIDAELWSRKEIQNTDFHYDWTYSTPLSVATSGAVLWIELPQSGLNLALLQDTSQPILYFDDIELYEDDLHDNGVVNVRVKLRLMPTCLYVLSRCWCRVDGTLLRCRETRTMVEFGDTPQSHRVYRDITWRQCQWTDLIQYNLPTDARAWKNEGTTETPAWNALLNRLPIIPLPDGIFKHSVMEEQVHNSLEPENHEE